MRQIRGPYSNWPAMHLDMVRPGLGLIWRCSMHARFVRPSAQITIGIIHPEPMPPPPPPPPRARPPSANDAAPSMSVHTQHQCQRQRPLISRMLRRPLSSPAGGQSRARSCMMEQRHTTPASSPAPYPGAWPASLIRPRICRMANQVHPVPPDGRVGASVICVNNSNWLPALKPPARSSEHAKCVQKPNRRKRDMLAQPLHQTR